jgi:hypothetical protein
VGKIRASAGYRSLPLPHFLNRYRFLGIGQSRKSIALEEAVVTRWLSGIPRVQINDRPAMRLDERPPRIPLTRKLSQTMIPPLDFRKFSFGSIEIDGLTYEHDVVIDRGNVRKRKKKRSRQFRAEFGHTPVSNEESASER